MSLNIVQGYHILGLKMQAEEKLGLIEDRQTQVLVGNPLIFHPLVHFRSFKLLFLKNYFEFLSIEVKIILIGFLQPKILRVFQSLKKDEAC